MYGENRTTPMALLGKHEGKKPLARPGCRWEDNIKMYFKETGWDGVDRIPFFVGSVKWQTVVITVMNTRVP